MRIHDLPTPCAVIDPDRLERNARRMRDIAVRLGVSLRPHVKTHKCVEIGRIQSGESGGGITVSTLAETEHFAAAGFADLTYAVPIAPDRIERAARIGDRLERLSLLLDNPEVLDLLERKARDRGRRFPVFLKVDCGYHRAGVDPSHPASIDLARRIAGSSGVKFRGILTHAGHAYRCRDRNEIAAVAAEERNVMLSFRDRLEEAGVGVPVSSIGSTPTMCVARDLSGIDEIRPGNYVFFDAFQAAVGSCRLEDAAFTVLTTVVGRYRARGEAVIDAGALALSRDPGPVHVDPSCGYGALRDIADRPIPARSPIVSVSQEHGLVSTGEGTEEPDRFRIGGRFRVVPNHSCLAAAMFDRYHVVRGEEVVDVWRPVRGW